MASYNGNIDLLSLNGAQVFTGIDQKNPGKAYVCIPVDLNDIRVESVNSGAQGTLRTVARLRVNIWPLNEQYKARVRQTSLERGDSNVSVPTHEMQISYSTDFVKHAARSLPKLVEEVRKANAEHHPEFAAQDPTDENMPLFKAIRSRMNKRIAMLYQPQTAQQPSPYQSQAAGYAQAGGASVYTPTAATGGAFEFEPDEDLPF